MTAYKQPNSLKLKAVDFVLAEWGRWMRDADSVLGWRKSSLIAKIHKDRDGANQATAPVEIPEGVMVTDAAIAKLPDIRKQVIKVAYLHCPNLPSEVQRRRLRMSRHRWARLLREGRQFVAWELGLPTGE